MFASNHAAVKVASAAGGVVAFAVVCEAADLAARTLGVVAGAAVIGAVFAACWIVSRVRPLLHPVSQRPREPQLPAQAGNASAESRVSDLLPVL